MNTAKLFGINYSNRDFTQKESWGKNQFNSSFPASLAAYLYSQNLENIYLTLDKNLEIKHRRIATSQLFGLEPTSKNLFYSFESVYLPYQQLLVGTLPRVDLVTINKQNGQALRPIEIKLTALPDNSTHHLNDDKYGTEIVVRPDTIVYLACSMAKNFENKQNELKKYFTNDFLKIKDWTDGAEVWQFLPKMIQVIDLITLSILENQTPILMQPIWKTEGKSPVLAQNCLDIFVWSNLAFIQLFLNVARKELSTEHKITRQIRSIIWLFKMLYDFSKTGKINHNQIIDKLSYNTKNDKAFAVSGRIIQPYMTCNELTKPRIKKDEIKNIILGNGQNLLSPERRFDAIVYSSSELFK
jgi:hypothetical protein